MGKSTLVTNFQDDILATSMGGKRRYRLIHNSDGTVSLEDVTTYTQVGSNFGASQVNATNTAVNASLATDGNGSNLTNTFSQASARSNLSTGEKLSVSLGKIMKWFADLKDAAFRSVANNLTTSSSGSSVLDAYQGYLLNNNKTNNSNIIDTLADVVANTQSKKPAGSLALKAAYNELNGKLADTGWQNLANGRVSYRVKNGWCIVNASSVGHITLSGSSDLTKTTLIATLPAGARPTQLIRENGTAMDATGYDPQFDITADGQILGRLNKASGSINHWAFNVSYPV